MTVSIWQAHGTQPREAVDFLIIGAGLAGCTAAYFAAQAGHEVTILDKGDVGLGASSRNAGFMLTGLDTYYHRAIEKYGAEVTREIWKLSQRTHDIWHTFIQEAEGAVQFEQCGMYLLAESPEEMDELRLAYQAMQAGGVPCIFHEKDPLGRGYYGAIEQAQDGAIQPYELVKFILQKSGAHFVPNTELYHLEQNSRDCVTVFTQKTIYEARTVLLCTNAFSANVHPYFQGKVIPTRAQCIATTPLAEPVLKNCGYSNYGAMYYRMTFDGRLLIGGGRQIAVALEHDSTDDRVNPPVQHYLEHYLRERFPEVDAPIDRRWAGIMGFSADGLPLVGVLPDMTRVGFAVGFHGHGLALSAGTVERAVEFLLHGTSPGAVDARRL